MGSEQNEYFEIVLLPLTTGKSTRFRKGETPPYGMVSGPGGVNSSARVESFTETGDWIDIHLTGGYRLSFHELRIDRIVTAPA